MYAYENLAYYYGMHPNEYWNCEYLEVVKFCDMNYLKDTEKLRETIIVQEQVTNKLIQADAMSNKRPKVISLTKIFKDLFKK